MTESADRLERKRYTASFNKFLEDKKIGLFTPIYAGGTIGQYSGKFYVDMAKSEIQMKYYAPHDQDNPIAVPDKINLKGKEFSITYSLVEREQVASQKTLDDMFAGVKKPK
jgi:hypothetical protein